MAQDTQYTAGWRKELALFAALLLVGLVLLPAAVYGVGNAIFGGYSPGGFANFYGDVHQRLRSGEAGAWFLILSPYLVCQALRAGLALFRTGPKQPELEDDEAGDIEKRREPRMPNL